MMPKVLICTVGGQPDPVAKAVLENQPLEMVYFLCSTGNSINASSTTIRASSSREIHGHCPLCEQDYRKTITYRPLLELAELEERQMLVVGVEDPDNLGLVLEACAQIEKDIQRRWPESEPDVIANYTGGTKTMSLGLGLFALQGSRQTWSLQLNRMAGGRLDLIRIRGGDQPVFQNSSGLLASSVAALAKKLADRYDYEGASQMISQVLVAQRPPEPIQQALLQQQRRYRLLAAKEALQFSVALEFAQQDADLKEVFAPRLQLLVGIIKALESTEAWPEASFTGLELIDELRENADRLAARNRFYEATARLRRATVLLAHLRLRRRYGSKVVKILKPLLQAHQEAPDLAAYVWLAEQGDALGHYFVNQRETLLGVWRRQQNHLLAEGFEMLDRPSWLRLCKTWQTWLDGAQEFVVL